mgnify:CR=1 FL=1
MPPKLRRRFPWGGWWGTKTMLKNAMKTNETVKANDAELAALREHFAGCFTKEGAFDLKAFSARIRDQVAVTEEGYQLDFLGKNYARLLANEETETVIVPDEAHNAKPENAKSENVYISGDNLDALKHLLKSYEHEVKCIYIDPPYNTGNEGWCYNDNVNDPRAIYFCAPANRFSNVMSSQETYYDALDTDRAEGCIRDLNHAYTKDGGLAVLKGNIALDGCVVKTAGVDENIWKFSGPARVYDSQEAAVDGILDGEVKAGDVVVITHEGPKGGPGMQEMLYPTSYLKSRHLGKECALITDGRFSGGTSGLSIGHVSPEAAAGGAIGKIIDGDIIDIDIPTRSISVRLSDAELAARPMRPVTRDRQVPKSLKAYASMVSSADKGAIRLIEE